MPSSIIRRSQGLVPMTDYPLGRAGSYRPDEPVISPASFGAIGVEIGTSVALAISGTYPAANRALGYMFTLCDYYLVRKVWWVNGTTATTDSADVGVYNEAGTTLLVSGGSTAIATANVVQQNGVTATPYSWSISANQQRAWGCAQFAGAVPLGSTFTPAAVVGTIFPHFGIANRTQVA
jgi:hypothetical protein